MAYKPSKSPVLKGWSLVGGFSVGRWLVTKAICFAAPYFGSIKPRLTTVVPGKVEVVIKKRRRVLNHLKTVHAIAMCNAAELVGGLCLEVSLHGDMRWIPVGMTVKYQKMAKTDLTATALLDDYSWETEQDVVVPVSVRDIHGVEVFSADITMHISPKPGKRS